MKLALVLLLVLLIFCIGYFLMGNLDNLLNGIVQEKHDIADRYSFDFDKEQTRQPDRRKKSAKKSKTLKNRL